jgi:hypothetical protein
MSGDIGNGFAEFKDVGTHLFEGGQIFLPAFHRHRSSLLRKPIPACVRKNTFKEPAYRCLKEYRRMRGEAIEAVR